MDLYIYTSIKIAIKYCYRCKFGLTYTASQVWVPNVAWMTDAIVAAVGVYTVSVLAGP